MGVGKEEARSQGEEGETRRVVDGGWVGLETSETRCKGGVSVGITVIEICSREDVAHAERRGARAALACEADVLMELSVGTTEEEVAASAMTSFLERLQIREGELRSVELEKYLGPCRSSFVPSPCIDATNREDSDDVFSLSHGFSKSASSKKDRVRRYRSTSFQCPVLMVIIGKTPPTESFEG